MEKDLAPELIDKILKEFREKTDKSKIIIEQLEALKSKKVSHTNTYRFAQELGKILRKTFEENLQEGVLPNDTLYFNIASRLINTTFEKDYKLVTDYGAQVQEILNGIDKLSIKAQIPKINQDRIDNLIDFLTDRDDLEEVRRALGRSTENFTESIVDDLIKENLDFLNRVGVKKTVIRIALPTCCEYCSQLAGVYEYGSEPKDIWKRHTDCHCTIEVKKL